MAWITVVAIVIGVVWTAFFGVAVVAASVRAVGLFVGALFDVARERTRR